MHVRSPKEIISDNGKQFAEGYFPNFSERLKIQQNFTSVYHPQGNGQVEVTNRDIIKGIEKCLAILPAELQVLTNSTAIHEENEENLRFNLDLLEERRKAALIREASYKRMIESYYNMRVKPSTFRVGDYVLRLNSTSKVEYEGNLGPNWEGPYVISQVLGKGSYKLETTTGKPIPRSWNGENLRKFYH
ncbi:uncharacterized protein [Rutidosis leptorrhynchoides]|uniref:uncharacterized protein n=1 Tax=Rutidosis leptorrhynchoides TaxID=125765 RepID=UPI003A994491